jgi:hypothetical protein
MQTYAQYMETFADIHTYADMQYIHTYVDMQYMQTYST